MQDTIRFSPPEKKTPSPAIDLSISRPQGIWLPVFLVGLYFLFLWQPPLIPLPNLRWYMVLGLSVFAYILHKLPLNLKAASVFWSIYGLSFFGAILSILRAPSLDSALWNTVGAGIAFVTFLFFLPVLATKQARRFLLIILITAAVLWSFEIQQLVAKHGILVYSTFLETDGDKNHIGLLLALASTVLFYLTVFGVPLKLQQKWQIFLIRMILFLGGVYLVYTLSLIYARSGILTVFVGMLSIIGIKLVQDKSGRSFISIIFIVAIMIFLLGNFILPKILEVSPAWEYLLRSTLTGTVANRFMLLQKGWFLVSTNPFIGVGLGGSRAAISSSYGNFPSYLTHNAYLTDWAEKGILGLLSNIVWIFIYLRFTRKNFFILSVFDQIWLLIFFLVFFEMNFINMGSISMMMLAIFSGIYYEQYLAELRRSEQLTL